MNTQKSMFWSRNRKIIHTPANPTFPCIQGEGGGGGVNETLLLIAIEPSIIIIIPFNPIYTHVYHIKGF